MEREILHTRWMIMVSVDETLAVSITVAALMGRRARMCYTCFHTSFSVPYNKLRYRILFVVCMRGTVFVFWFSTSAPASLSKNRLRNDITFRLNDTFGLKNGPMTSLAFRSRNGHVNTCRNEVNSIFSVWGSLRCKPARQLWRWWQWLLWCRLRRLWICLEWGNFTVTLSTLGL